MAATQPHPGDSPAAPATGTAAAPATGDAAAPAADDAAAAPANNRDAASAGPAWEICRVYVHPSRHGSGLGHALLDAAEAHAVAAGAARLVLWSDTRFARAHRFYEKRCFVRCGPIRVLQDISQSLEFAYAKPVHGIMRLDAAAAASAEHRLADILIACVAGGAGISFLPPLAPAVARGFWKRITADIAAGTRHLFAGWVRGTLAGTVILDTGMPPNQPHRAEVQKLLVHPEFRRHGLARALMRRAEQQAGEAGRTLLTLDTRAGDAAEQLYRASGWHEAGRIPGFARDAAGAPHDTVFFWKDLAAAVVQPPPAGP
jgi:GNAT superfamily N-acetyltransferase